MVLCVCACFYLQNVPSTFGASTPVGSFPVARREPAFRLLFNKPAARAYWLWMNRDPPLGEKGQKGRLGGVGGGRDAGRCRQRSASTSSFLVGHN